MAKEQPIEVEGIVVDTYPNATFDVKLANGHIVKAHIAGRLRKNNIRIILGDPVRIELSPYDLSNGRIVYRNKG